MASPLQLSTSEQILRTALTHHAEGRLAEAQALYREVLAAHPNHVDAVHNLGVIAHQVGKHQDAIELINQAIAINGEQADFHWNLGLVFQALGRSTEMVSAFSKSVSLIPSTVRLVKLADYLLTSDNHEQALEYYRQAQKLDPDNVQVLTGLGESLRRAKYLAEAKIVLERAVALDPRNSDALSNFGATLYNMGRHSEAADCFRRAIEFQPRHAGAHANLGELLRQLGHAEESLVHCRMAVELSPTSAVAHDNLGNAYRDLGDLDGAEAGFRRAIELDPGFGKARSNLGMKFLLTGAFREGWAEYEGRWQAELVNRHPQPPWDLGCPQGSTVLVHHEQGFGDTLQFLRYVPLIEKRGCKVVLEVQSPLVDLARGISGATVIASGADHSPCDFQIPLLSLPRVFETTLDTIPASVPYLRVDAATCEHWRRKPGNQSKVSVGFAWAGNPALKNDAMRTIPLTLLGPLFALPGVRACVLQKELRQNDEKTLVEFGVENLAAEFESFNDTAAVIKNLDLIISVDTSVAHLAGALGSPVWVMLPVVPDWRWMLNREDSPWYPTMRLFRQKRRGDWPEVIERVAKQLTELVALASHR